MAAQLPGRKNPIRFTCVSHVGENPGLRFRPRQIAACKTVPTFLGFSSFQSCLQCMPQKPREQKKSTHTKRLIFLRGTYITKEGVEGGGGLDGQTDKGRKRKNKTKKKSAGHPIPPMGTMIPPSPSAWVRHSHNDKNPPGIPSRVFAP